MQLRTRFPPRVPVLGTVSQGVAQRTHHGLDRYGDTQGPRRHRAVAGEVRVGGDCSVHKII